MKRILFIALLILGARCGAQTYGRLQFQLANNQGQAIAGATVTVYSQPSCGAAQTGTATIYPAATGGTPLPQPLYTDGNGQSFAYATVACYTVQYSSPYTGTQTYIDQVPQSPASSSGGGSVGEGTAGQLCAYSITGTSCAGVSSISGITVDGSSPTAIGYVANVTSDIQAQLNALQPQLTLTTTGSSGAATLVGSTLNIPQYTGGGGGSSVGTAGQVQKVGSTAGSFAAAACTDNGVLWLCTEPQQVNDGTGVGGTDTSVCGTPPTGASGSANFFCDATYSRWMVINNNGTESYAPVVPVGSTIPVGHVWVSASSTVDPADGGVPPGTLLASGGPTGQTANISSTTLYTTTAAGRYTICVEGAISTAATSSSTFPDLIAVWTSSIDSNLKNQIMGIGGLSTTNATYEGSAACITVAVTSGSTIGYKTSGYVSSGATAMAYYLKEYVYSAN